MKDYFSHDSNARNSDKLLRLRAKYKAEGYGVYFMILERLRDEADYTSDRDYEMLAFDFRVDIDLVRAIIEDFGLFAFTEDGTRFYSDSFNRRMQAKDSISKARSEAAQRGNEKRWGSKNNDADTDTESRDDNRKISQLRQDDITNASQNIANVSQTHRKAITNASQNIANKRKEKENNISLSFSPSFDEVEKNDETGGKSAEPTATERENFFRIFFFKNFLSPDTEVSRFIDHYEATGWTRNGGAKVKDRVALARSWASKDEKKRFPPNFLVFWQELYNAFEKSGATTQSLHELLCDLRGFSEDGRALLLTLTPSLHEFIENSTPIVKPIFQKHYPKCLLNYSLMP